MNIKDLPNLKCACCERKLDGEDVYDVVEVEPKNADKKHHYCGTCWKHRTRPKAPKTPAMDIGKAAHEAVETIFNCQLSRHESEEYLKEYFEEIFG